jgi:hypothetical protein
MSELGTVVFRRLGDRSLGGQQNKNQAGNSPVGKLFQGAAFQVYR